MSPFQPEIFYDSKVPSLGTATMAPGYIRDQENSQSGYSQTSMPGT